MAEMDIDKVIARYPRVGKVVAGFSAKKTGA